MACALLRVELFKRLVTAFALLLPMAGFNARSTYLGAYCNSRCLSCLQPKGLDAVDMGKGTENRLCCFPIGHNFKMGHCGCKFFSAIFPPLLSGDKSSDFLCLFRGAQFPLDLPKDTFFLRKRRTFSKWLQWVQCYCGFFHGSFFSRSGKKPVCVFVCFPQKP